jgi:3-oxoacyl-[acyl-carrier-protein] synthase-3
MSVSISTAKKALPPKVVTNDSFPQTNSDGKENLMFAGTKERRHCERDDLASDLLVKAAKELLHDEGITAEKVGLLLTNATMLDIPFNGVGAAWAHGLDIAPQYIYDIHNTGCTSFVYMVELANNLMATLDIEYALIGNVQMSAGKIFAQEQNVGKPQSVVPGDGAGVVLVRKEAVEGDGEIVAVATKVHGEFANDMYIEREDGSHWWEPSEAMGIIEFPKSRIMRILSRGNRSVPERIREVCEKAGKKITDIDFLITNQPNMTFLRNWREFVQLPEEKHQQSYASYGNLFGAAMPINLTEAQESGAIKKGDLVCFAGFSHAGDYSSAMLVQY